MSVVTYADRFNLHEEKDPQSWKYYIQQLAQRWDPEETILSEDKNEFNGLNPRYKLLVKDIVAFFAPGDGLVCEQVLRLMLGTDVFAQRAFMGEQFSIEVAHARAYKDIVMTFFEGEEREEIFNMVDTLPCVTEKAEFVSNYMENDKLPWSLRCVAAAVSEGVFFVSLFAIIFYLKEKKLLPRFCFINEQVAKDEKLHRDFYLLMAKRGFLKGDFTASQVLEIVRKGVAIEMTHIRYILREPIDSPEIDAIGGLTTENMDRFIATLGDQIVTSIGINRCFTYEENEELISGQADPILLREFEPNWMKGLSMARKTNFYESIVGNYTMISKQKKVSLDVVFDNLETLDI